MIDLNTFISEAVSNSNLNQYVSTIEAYLKKYKIYVWNDLADLSVKGGSRYWITVAFDPRSNYGAVFMWKQSDRSSEISSISFTKDYNDIINRVMFGGDIKIDVKVDLKGASLGNVLPIVKDVVAGKKMSKDDIEKAFKVFTMYESINESSDIDKRLSKLYRDIRKAKANGEDYTVLQQEFDQVKAMQRAERVAIKTGVAGTVRGTVDIAQQEQEFEERATPEERFSDMEHYLDMVIRGIQPSLLICGAPGVGKTFRVMKKIKASGLDYLVIKGKETAASLYKNLFRYSHNHQIIIADDADELLTDDVAVNLLKAATDSSDERIVSYGTSKPPIMMDEEYVALSFEDQEKCLTQVVGRGEVHFYPKNFITEGRIVIITNRNAGQIDTAIRNRGLICDLSFTNQECLELIRDIMPAIMPDKLDMTCKVRALEFLNEVADSGSSMSISIRSFTTCAKVFAVIDDDDKQAMRMIKEQMRLQSLRGGKKY